MKVEIKKSGNSATLRIPTDVLRSLDLVIGDEMVLNLTDQGLFFKKIENAREGWFDGIDDQAAKQAAESMEQDFSGIQNDGLDDLQNGDLW